MEVTVRVPERLAEEARARGVSVELYVQEILARRGLDRTVLAVIDRILELRKGNTLASLHLKELIH